MKIFITAAIFSIISLSIFYIYQTNLEVSERYLVQEYTKKISDFSGENKVLEISSAKSSSLDKMTNHPDTC